MGFSIISTLPCVGLQWVLAFLSPTRRSRWASLTETKSTFEPTQRRQSTFHLIECESQVSRRPSLIWIFLLSCWLFFFARRRQCLFKWHRRCFEGFDLGFWLFALGSLLSDARSSSETQTNWRWDCSSGFVGRVPNQLELAALTRWICHPQSTNIYIFLVGPLSFSSLFSRINKFYLDLFFGRKKILKRESTLPFIEAGEWAEQQGWQVKLSESIKRIFRNCSWWMTDDRLSMTQLVVNIREKVRRKIRRQQQLNESRS